MTNFKPRFHYAQEVRKITQNLSLDAGLRSRDCNCTPRQKPRSLRLSPLGTAATVWPIVPAPDDR
jgi:hypothetical protein